MFNQASELANQDLASLLKSVTERTVANQPVRAIYFVRILAIIKWLTHADYWMLSAYFSLFSFLGCAYLADKIARWKSELAYPAHIAFLYYPSIVFWSSGLLKESLAFGALTFLVGTYFSRYQSRKLHAGNIFIAAVALLIIVFIKYYIAAALIPLLIYLALYHMSFWSKTGVSGIWKKTGLLMVVLALPILLFLSWLSPNLSYGELWRVMQASHYEYIRLVPDGALHTLTWFGSNLDTVVNLPYLGFSGIFRPLIGEDMTFPAVLSSLENSVLLVAAVISFSLFFKVRRQFSPELLAVIIYISGLSIFLSYSAPNFGTLARFKIYYVPFVIMLVVYQLKSTKILSKD
ncbi:hypothetical protein [Reichenbachiella sp.]|uniref:hypothetical protein n=2 Tax=Reichenbachiella sp. TaxID=2184521 RepID=UPI003299582E